MSGIRTNAAAELLGVSPNTLRSWERRFGYPAPRRTQGGHRQYELGELEALRRALLETHNISSAIQVAQQRGEGPGSANRLLEAFDRFDDALADRFMEESLALRSVERSVEELLLPAVERAECREGREAECEFACRWATGWLHAARRVAPPATREDGVLLFDASARFGSETLQVQALELALRRAGLRTLALTADVHPGRTTRALRTLAPRAVVLTGRRASLDMLGRLVYAARRATPLSGPEVEVLDFRGALQGEGSGTVPRLGPTALGARNALLSRLEAHPDGRAVALA